MKLKNCTHGILVKNNGSTGPIGMIVGITNSCPSCTLEQRKDPARAIPLVQWAHGGTSSVHPSNIEPLK